MTSVVFAGPSVHGIGLDRYPGLTFLPPAACGDLLRAAKNGATAIGLIDGLFENVASVWHKEILYALAKGVRVFGSSSMGALRAAECHHFGMEGVGKVFFQYASGRRTRDADVALLHAPAELGFAPLTEPLVDVDATIERLLEAGHVSAREADWLGSSALALHYKRRTWTEITASSRFDGSARTRIQIAAHQFAVHQKKKDAEALLLQISHTGLYPGKANHIALMDFSNTAFFSQLEGRL